MTDNKYELITRSYEFRSEDVDTDKREIRGIAVPFNKDAQIGNAYIERFAPGAVQDSEGALYFWRHSEPVGRIISARDTEAGWEIVARVSETTLGNDALTLARDGVVKELSVGFEPGGEYEIEERENDIPIVTRTKVRVREVSQVPFGAYSDGATISEVRAASSVSKTNKEGQIMTDETKGADLIEIREAIEDLDRKFSTLDQREEEPALDTRSAGELLKEAIAGDESAVETLNRAYTGGVQADGVNKPEGLVNLVRIFDASSGVLAQVFSTGNLPATGNTLEFVELGTNTLSVTEQANEGDDIPFGKITFTTRTVPVKTYAGGAELSRQAIERSTVGVLNTTLEGLALEAGKRKKIVLRNAFNTVVAARTAIASNGGVVVLGATLAAATADNWTDALVDAAVKYDGLAIAPEALVVSATVFKKLSKLTVAGERVFTLVEKNAIGSLNLPGLSGNLAGIPVYLDASQAGDSAVFVNGRAIKQYDSALISLSDDKISNLTKAFAVYRYGAVADELPSGIVPIKLAAS